ncbi:MULTISPECIES: hypothetical protein [unclassified Mucilaginibacter]|uniref:hypothetical protein n=1 Tax=unclassified Mucilaginibacter TaxID=2617802 RepID=UPI002AC9E643|nr:MULTISPECIES: hypothetical protein [unclassified Mucilaginibacter]MEB0260694.1 hypothetical protein [Mucilaginibacter sp. 10I4]MEB0280634.1 hypothetical protein [Mucilaginibacter sp. 10B2]MEB0300954.1 hypothetical protein [Mucilaginibacter sp. 5C4]WPX24949.1 hypothetical protein RHM67_06680 [Mucilaginibacter sp. 5C4]
MKNFLLFFLLGLLLSSCVSTQKLFDKGEYDKAFYAAISDLKKNSSDANAKKILPDAYKEASSKYEQDIAAAKSGNGKKVAQLAGIYNGYVSLQKMYDAVEQTAKNINDFSPKDYNVELNQAASNAADAHYIRGLALLQRNDRMNARKAYGNLKLADDYVPGYKDVITKKQQAYDAAITNVMVTKIDQRFGYYTINGNFFEKDILWNLNMIGNSNYYQFYSTNNGQATNRRIDQLIELNMHDLWFSNLATNNYSYTVSKIIPIKNDKMAGSNSTIKVSATIQATRRVINSRAIMDYQITDAASGKMIATDHIPAQYTWESLTGKYTGDSRALDNKDWSLVKGNFDNRPGYDDLYQELTRQIMTQFNFRMRNIYQ